MLARDRYSTRFQPGPGCWIKLAGIDIYISASPTLALSAGVGCCAPVYWMYQPLREPCLIHAW